MSEQWSHASREAPLLRHPRTFRSPDVTLPQLSLAVGPRCAANEERWRQCHLFARRFADDTLQPLMRLLPLAMPAKVDQSKIENREGQAGAIGGCRGRGGKGQGVQRLERRGGGGALSMP